MKSKTIRRRVSGFSLTEAIIATALGTIAISGAAALNSQQMRLVGDTRQASAASHALQERLEQVRTATWRQITDAQFVANTLMATAPRSVAPLHGYEETISISGWPESSSAMLKVMKTPKRAAEVLVSGEGITEERLLKVVVQMKWTGSGHVGRVRELATILSNGGVSRVNLPAMGPVGGGAWDATDADSSGESSAPPDETTEPVAGGTSSEKPGPEKGGGAPGDDKGNGRGNVGGAPGIK